ncbi:MAG: thioesterase, partial [Angelakisella sp.]
MSMKTYRCRRVIESAYCDSRGEAKLSQLLAAAQQISQEHCEAAGIGDSFFRNRGLAFLLAKLRFEIITAPHGGQQLELFTQPNLPTRAQYRRVTDFLDDRGALCCKLDSRWVLVDLESRRLLRHPPEDITLPFLDVAAMPDLRASLPDTLTPRESVTVRYSMIDLNGHMNNTV